MICKKLLIAVYRTKRKCMTHSQPEHIGGKQHLLIDKKSKVASTTEDPPQIPFQAQPPVETFILIF